MPLTTGVKVSDEWFLAKFEVPAGVHKLEWTYKKINLLGTSDDLAAWIDYIEINGVKRINTECQPCDKGVPNENGTMCVPCELDHYLEPSTPQCVPCPYSKFAPMGSVGQDACRPRPPCTDDDMEFTFGDCENGKRVKSYNWREPKICSEESGKMLHPTETANCRGCGKGSYFNESSDHPDKCDSCPDGFYQEVDNRDMKLGHRVQ